MLRAIRASSRFMLTLPGQSGGELSAARPGPRDDHDGLFGADVLVHPVALETLRVVEPEQPFRFVRWRCRVGRNRWTECHEALAFVRISAQAGEEQDLGLCLSRRRLAENIPILQPRRQGWFEQQEELARKMRKTFRSHPEDQRARAEPWRRGSCASCLLASARRSLCTGPRNRRARRCFRSTRPCSPRNCSISCFFCGSFDPLLTV